MTDLPVAGFFSNASRVNAEAKQGQDDMLAFIRQMLGGQAESTLVLATDAAAPTRGVHAIDTEGTAASDDLKNLATTNLPDGSFLMLRGLSAARVVTVKHNAGGSGQIALVGAADAVLDATSKWLLLKRTGANWEEVGRFGFAGGGTLTAGRGVSANANGTQGGTITGNGTLRIMATSYENVSAATTTNLANISNATSTLNITGNNVTITGFSGLAGLPDIPFKIGNGTITLQTGGNLTISAGNITLAANSTGIIRPLTNTTAEIVGAQNANGSALAGGASAMTLIGQTIVSTNVTSVDFTNFSMSSYKALELQIVGVEPTTIGNVLMRVSDDNGATFYAAGYDSDAMWNNGTTFAVDTAGDGFILNGGGGVFQSGHGLFCTAVIRPNAAGQKISVNFMSHQYDAAGGNQVAVAGGGINNSNSSSAKNAIRIVAASGNLRRATSTNGTITLWGKN